MAKNEGWDLIKENMNFRSNIDDYLSKYPQVWSFDCQEDIVAVVVDTKDCSQRHCAIFNGDGQFQYAIPTHKQFVRVTSTHIYLSIFHENTVIQLDRTTGKERQFLFPKGVTDFEIDPEGKLWVLYGGYYESERLVSVDFGARKKVGIFSLEQLMANALVKREGEAPLEEVEYDFDRCSSLSRSADGYPFLYDPRARCIYEGKSKQKIEMDHSAGNAIHRVLSLKDWIILQERVGIPHEDTGFATFFVYALEPGWHTYAANVEKVLYTPIVPKAAFYDARVMDDVSIIIEERMQRSLSKYTFAPKVKQLGRDQPQISNVQPGKFLG